MANNYRDPELVIPEQTTPTTPSTSNPLLHNTRCSCFCIPSSWWDRVRRSAADNDRRWWARALLKAREWSELVAGPKWKTFIRRFNRNRGGHQHHHHHHHGKFQYDPLSYSLNFDEGGQIANFDKDEDFGGYPDFSARYAAVPSSGKPLAAAAVASG